MAKVKKRIIIADKDQKYIIPLQFKFAKEYFDKIDLEIITDEEYFDKLFQKPQTAEALIVSDEMYDSSLQKHNIKNIFMMMENNDDWGTMELNIIRIFKYTNIKTIFNEVVSRIDVEDGEDDKEADIILVTSANGGAGKTTIAMGVSACLTKSYKRVLYINASRLQSFQYMLDNDTPISSPEIYSRLAAADEHIYTRLKHVIRQEIFSYIPPFKVALMSVGVDYSVYEKIALSAKASGEYDYIVIDAESTFDEEKTKLLDVADKVIVVTNQSAGSVHYTNSFVANINGITSDKYIFVCNKFNKDEYNALIMPNIPSKFSVNEYVDGFVVNGLMNCEMLSKQEGIQKIAFLMI